MSEFSSADILKALSHVDDPDLKKDIVTLGMVKQLEFDENRIKFDVELTTPACPMKDMIENACRNAITHFISKDIEIVINMTAQTTSSTSSDLLPGVKNIIAVASGKGGVGKSSVSALLALSLANSGAKVGLLDGDMYGPSIPTMFGLTDYKPKSKDVDGKPIMIPAEVNGIKLFSIGFLADPRQAIVWRGPMLSKAFRQTLPLTGAVIVTTPQDVALADAQRAISMFGMQGIERPVLGVVENMSYFVPEDAPEKKYAIFGEGGGQKLAKANQVQLLGQIPINIGVGKLFDTGNIAIDAQKLTFFNDIAGNIVRQIAITNNQAKHNGQ
jgi:ATP-binding protein involved in chromosome partitioning